jgi:hypothetical protein
MRHIALAIFTSAIIAGSYSITAVTAAAQTAPAACPRLQIDPSDGTTSEGTRELLSAVVVGGPASVKPEFKWTTTGGKGEMGTTPGIAWLDTTGVAVGTQIVVEVEAFGYGCTVKGRTTIKMVKRDLTRCPTITVASPDTTKSGTPVTMTANVSGGDPQVSPTYNWSVSSGTISSGQGTSSITLDTTGVSMPITGSVDVGGFARDCRTFSSSTTIIERGASRKFDEFGAMVNTEDQYARLDNYAIDLRNDPSSQAVLIFYAGRKSRVGAIEALTDQTKKYLTIKRSISAGRIQTVNGGFRENGIIELWIMPQGAELPEASPTLDPSEAQQLPALKKPTVAKPKKS